MKDTKSIEGLKEAMASIQTNHPDRDEANVMLAWGGALVEYLEAGHQLFDLPWFQSYPADLQQALDNE